MSYPPLKSVSPARTMATGLVERPLRHFNQIELSRRWSISPRTLERWRWLDQGPNYLKIGGRVVYRLEDIEAFEASRERKSGAPKAGGPI
jgi:hypothetical protein